MSDAMSKNSQELQQLRRSCGYFDSWKWMQEDLYMEKVKIWVKGLPEKDRTRAANYVQELEHELSQKRDTGMSEPKVKPCIICGMDAMEGRLLCGECCANKDLSSQICLLAQGRGKEELIAQDAKWNWHYNISNWYKHPAVQKRHAQVGTLMICGRPSVPVYLYPSQSEGKTSMGNAVALPQGVSVQSFPNGTTVVSSPMNTTGDVLRYVDPGCLEDDAVEGYALKSYTSSVYPAVQGVITPELFNEVRKQIESHNPYAPCPELKFPYENARFFSQDAGAEGERGPRGSVAETHSMEIEMHDGTRIVIPPPGDGWVLVAEHDGKWDPAEVDDPYGEFGDGGLMDCGVAINALHEEGIRNLAVTHDAGRMVLAEYFRRLSETPARLVSWTSWRRE